MTPEAPYKASPAPANSSMSSRTPDKDPTESAQPASAERTQSPPRKPLEQSDATNKRSPQPGPAAAAPEVDDFGLPIQKRPPRSRTSSTDSGAKDVEATVEGEGGKVVFKRRRSGGSRGSRSAEEADVTCLAQDATDIPQQNGEARGRASPARKRSSSAPRRAASRSGSRGGSEGFVSAPASRRTSAAPSLRRTRTAPTPERKQEKGTMEVGSNGTNSPESKRRSRAGTMAQIVEAGSDPRRVSGGVSEWSHQVLAPRPESLTEAPEEDEWKAMPALGRYDLYDDEGHLVAKGAQDSDSEDEMGARGGAKKGYTRVQDDDAKSATSMDENTSYLFTPKGTDLVEEDDQRDQLAQMQATKDLMTEGQRIAYVGVTRLSMAQMLERLEEIEKLEGLHKEVKKAVAAEIESMKKWSQKMMVRLYGHMEIDSSEQVMIEQLAEHGVQPGDLTPALMQNARVKNPMADLSSTATQDSAKTADSHTSLATETADEPPPPYSLESHDDLPAVRNPDDLPATRSLDIDLRWTALCDLFLVLIADSAYDARSRVLLERVGAALDVPWVDICRFEKRVTDALEMQEAAAREDWDEGAHIEQRRKLALRRRYMVMGLATVGGSLVIGLSAGLLAPVIGAGLAAGFTTIGVTGTGGFLAGTGGAALIAGIGVTTGGTIGVRAGRKRMGPVRTFEYRPLHNNKRVNLVVSVSGWMTGKVDDVRLPFSTVDPVMGDMYSVLWEPDMLCSIGDTIRILATEALSQSVQHVLGATILTALMASLTLPIALTKLSYLLDNPWTVSLARADAAGLILADSIIDRNLGVRPITLVGFSIGARVIFSCLKELSRKGAHGLVQNVYLFGSPVIVNKTEYLRARAVVSGRWVNGYATNDWILGYLFRATSGGVGRVAGLRAVEGIPGLENVDVTEWVPGHMVYREAMPRLLMEVGWEVTSEEFDEIEDPDPENHEARQRELIREIEDARKEADAKKGRRFGLFKRSKLAEKKGWETYDMDPAAAAAAAGAEGGGDEKTGIKNDRVLFDVEAIRRELEGEKIEIKQLESTLPPMQLDLRPKDLDADAATTVNARSAGMERTNGDVGVHRPAPRPSKSADASTFPRAANLEAPAKGRMDNAASKDEPNSASTPEHRPADLESSPLPSVAPAWQNGSDGDSAAPPTQSRPPLRTSSTMPIDHNAWADEEAAEGLGDGKEGEVTMSFE